MQCDHSLESYSAVLSCWAICFVKSHLFLKVVCCPFYQWKGGRGGVHIQNKGDSGWWSPVTCRMNLW